MKIVVNCGIVFLVCVLTGCAVHKVKPDAVSPGLTKEESFSNYSIGQQLTSYVGEPVIRVKRYTVLERAGAVSATNDFEISGGLLSASFHVVGHARVPYPVVGRFGEDIRAVQLHGAKFMIGVTEEGTFSGDAGPFNAMTAPLRGVNQYEILPASTRFLPAVQQTILEGLPYTNHEILYSGSSGHTFGLLYREYSIHDLIRAAFSHELTYPVDAETIRFRRYEIKIISVTPEAISFVVTADE